MTHVALASANLHIDEDPDLPLLMEALAQYGIQVSCEAWTNRAINWSVYDLVVVRSCWDYASRRQEFLSWARSVPRLLNTPAVIRWNTNKKYLKALAGQGVEIIPTSWNPSKPLDLPPAEELVVKPTVSASAHDTFRVKSREEALRLASGLRARGKQPMVQPYLHDIETEGEIAVVYIDGELSHAVRKEAVLSHDDASSAHEPYEAIDPSIEIVRQADNVLAITENLVSPTEHLLYARIDLVPGAEGRSAHVMEVELAEPTLFHSIVPTSTDTFAAAIARRLHARLDDVGH